jgi:hypothetical protein
MKLLTTILALTALTSYASNIPDALAARAVAGEAMSEPYAAQLAVASSIRLRGSLRGVYGVNNPAVNRASARTLAIAQRAWEESLTNNTARGCRYFGCPADAGYFQRHGYHAVFTVGKITFWK